MTVNPGTYILRDRFEVLDPGGLVRDVLLVEGRRAGRLLVGEGAFMPLGGGCGIVGRCRGYVSQEGVVFGRRASDEIGGVPGEDVGEVVLFLAPVGDDLPRSRSARNRNTRNGPAWRTTRPSPEGRGLDRPLRSRLGTCRSGRSGSRPLFAGGRRSYLPQAPRHGTSRSLLPGACCP